MAINVEPRAGVEEDVTQYWRLTPKEQDVIRQRRWQFIQEGELDAPSPTPSSVRGQVLDEAKQVVLVDRNSKYGGPEENFSRIRDLWQTYVFHRFHGEGVAVSLTNSDVALMMILMKIGRLLHDPSHRDGWVDLAGYAACGFEVAQLEGEMDV